MAAGCFTSSSRRKLVTSLVLKEEQEQEEQEQEKQEEKEKEEQEESEKNLLVSFGQKLGLLPWFLLLRPTRSTSGLVGA